MITIPEIEKKILAKRETDIKEIEGRIDALLEAAWEQGPRDKIRFDLPSDVPRIVVDELARRYRANNAWAVEYSSKNPADRAASRFNVLEFSRYSPPSNCGRD